MCFVFHPSHLSPPLSPRTETGAALHAEPRVDLPVLELPGGAQAWADGPGERGVPGGRLIYLIYLIYLVASPCHRRYTVLSSYPAHLSVAIYCGPFLPERWTINLVADLQVHDVRT